MSWYASDRGALFGCLADISQPVEKATKVDHGTGRSRLSCRALWKALAISGGPGSDHSYLQVIIALANDHISLASTPGCRHMAVDMCDTQIYDQGEGLMITQSISTRS
jgi:hypothetical protein